MLYNLPSGSGNPGSNRTTVVDEGEKGIVVTESYARSPLGDTDNGKMVILANVSSRRIHLDQITLGDGVSPQHLVLPEGVVLDSAERVIVAYGNDSLQDGLVNLLGWPTDTTLQWVWQTDFVLADSGMLTVSVWDSTESLEIERIAYDGNLPPMAPGYSRSAFAARDAVVAAADRDNNRGFGAAWMVDGAPVERKSIKFGLGESYSFSKLRGTKRYELSDHLGNVAVVVSDRKLAQDPDADLDVDWFEGEVLSARDFYPYGFVMPERSFSTDAYRYGFSSHEKDDEIYGSGNSYDMGARLYNPRLGRTPTIDPHAANYPSVSPYAYSMNNPVLYVDLDGKDVYFYISAKPVGTTKIRLIGSENVEGAPSTIEVPVYQMSVTDDVTGKTSTYLVTRDAPVINQSDPANEANPILEYFGWDETTYNVQNTAFEPKSETGEYKAIGLEYPKGLGAYALRNLSGGENLEAENTPLRTGDATGVMIHVGGVYQTSDGSTRVTGSLGCFTLCGSDAGNDGMNRLVNDVYSRQQANKKAGTGTDVNVTIDKRNDVDWEFETDDIGTKQ